MSLRRMLVGAAAMAGLAGAALGSASPAFASEGDGVIEDGEFVVWRDCNFTGPRLVVNPLTAINLCGGPFDNQISSHHF